MPSDSAADVLDAADGTLDGSGDGGTTGDPPFCSTTSTATRFCWDFTGGDPAPNFGWTSTRQVPAATGTILEVAGTVGTPSRHLHVKAVAASAASSPGVQLAEELTTFNALADGQTVTLDFDFQVSSASVYAFIGGFQFGPSSTGTEYGLAINPAGGGKIAGIENDRADKPTVGSVLFTANAERHATVTLTRTGTAVGGSVNLGQGTVVNSRAKLAMPDGLFGPARVIVGAAFVGNNGIVDELTIDNVRVTLTP